MKTVIDILADSLIGKTIRVYEYEFTANDGGRKIQHYYTNDTQEQRDIYKHHNWRDLTINEIEVDIIGVGGRYEPYEGNYVNINIQLLDRETIINLKVDDKIKFV